MQKIKIGHRANFRAKYKCFPQISFPVRAILRSINFRCTDFNTDSDDAYILVMASLSAYNSIKGLLWANSFMVLAMKWRKCYLCIIVFNDVGGASISIKLFPGMYLSYQQAYNWLIG